MADSLSSTITTTISASKTFDVSGPGSTAIPYNLVHGTTLSNGILANQADHLHVRDFDSTSGTGPESDIPASGSGALDLNDPTQMLDAFGQSAIMAKVKALRIVHKSTSASTSVTVSGNFLDQLVATGTFSMVLAAGSELLIVSSDVNGFAVTATTQDVITITETTGSAAKVEVVVIGTSA